MIELEWAPLAARAVGGAIVAETECTDAICIDPSRVQAASTVRAAWVILDCIETTADIIDYYRTEYS